MQLQEEYFQTVKEKGLSKNLCSYVWHILICTSKGYGFEDIGPYTPNLLITGVIYN